MCRHQSFLHQAVPSIHVLLTTGLLVPQYLSVLLACDLSFLIFHLLGGKYCMDANENMLFC